MATIRILADDLTGALDSAAAFACVVPVYLERAPADGAPHDAPLAVVATPTRDVAAQTLGDALQPVASWFAAADLAFKKVDSLLRGNTFAEIAWLARHAGFARILFAPAFPQQGRLTLEDRQWLVRSGAERVALATPLRAAFAAVGLPADRQVWIPEVAGDGDLDAVVAQADAEGGWLWCGSAGLAHALARRRGLAPRGDAAAPLAPGAGPTLLVSASFQPVLHEQWNYLLARQRAGAAVRHARGEEIAAAIAAARAGAAELCFDLSPRERLTAAEAAELLAAHCQRLVAELPVPGQLIVVGGDTLLGLCRASGALALLAHPAVRAGWGCARLVGGAWDGVACYSRSGAFGGADDLVSTIRLLDGGDNRRKGN